MIDPKTIRQILGATGIIVSIIAAICGAFLMTEKQRQNLQQAIFNNIVEINPYFAVAGILGAGLVGFYALNAICFRRISALEMSRLEGVAQLENVRQQLDKANSLIRDISAQKYINIVTRIPNHSLWEVHIEKISSISSDKNPYHCIYLDLINFGEINKRFGYEKADKVIEYFAQTIYQGMRRNEDAYKRSMMFSDDDSKQIEDGHCWERIYRRYRGGDEFLFNIQGDEMEAVGFLNRLQEKIDRDINSHIANEILNDEWILSFHAYICPIVSNCDFKNQFRKMDEGLRIACNSTFRRVHWYSNCLSSDFDEGSLKRVIYSKAESLFAK